jgi:hypothetical protein
MRDEEKKLWERVDRLGEQWYALPAAGNEGAKKALEAEIFGLLFRLYQKQPDRQEALAAFFLQDWPRFDPAKSKLSTYVTGRLQHRVADRRRKDLGSRRVTTVDPATGEKQRVWRDLEPLDATGAAEDEQPSLLETTADTHAEDPQARLDADATAMELLTLMLHLSERLPGRANNPVRVNYFRLFFTDGVAALLHQQTAPAAYCRHERDLFTAMKVPFLDYFLAQPCRTVGEVAGCALKPYGQLAAGRGPEAPKQPLPNDVYTTYLAKIEGYTATAAAVSQQRTAFQKLRELLC